MSEIDFSTELNSQQWAAVQSSSKATLVIAGAGSGKTRTLTYRVAYLLNRGVDPRRILLLTFTNKAAKEMLGRVHRLGNYTTNFIFGGTFHSVCARILRSHSEKCGLSADFSIFDREDSKRLIKEVLSEQTEEKEFLKPRVLAEIFSLSKSLCVSVKKIIEEQYSYLNRFSEGIKNLFDVYEERKKRAFGVDFEDLLMLTVEILEKNKDVQEIYQERFQHILVDEYQDVNPIQARLIEILSEKAENLMVVGDDAQAIYSWRGASIDYILNFPKRYPDAQVFKVEKNYRST